MSSSRVNLEYYLISLEEIKIATEDFSPRKCIGGGGFGKVYIGELSEHGRSRTVAIKRLDQDSYQGEREFHNELEMISRFHHENIISFIGYCDESGEMIIVYDYAVNGSVDHHLQDPNKRRCITWTQRLKICLGAAKGLDYLHTGLEKDKRVIHRDVKSANILLDENFMAKICDFGLSKAGPRNRPKSELYTRVAGTQFYMDPAYHESGILRKESDVYSFGVVLFEMLSGMLVYCKRTTAGDDRPQSLMSLVRRYYDNNEVENLIDPDIRDQIDRRSFDKFIEIAYECINLKLRERPTMEKVVDRIREALNFQEGSNTGMKNKVPLIGKANIPPLVSRSKCWEQREVISKDGCMKLRTEVFFASIDERSEEAAGEGACSALVAVISNWFQNNHNVMPVKSQFDALIREGSLEWRRLCDNETYRLRFPDKHFDLETVLQAKIRPLSVVPGNSFISFFYPDEVQEGSFDFLYGTMSFNYMWYEISRDNEPRVYIVSWNDHFFVLKVDLDAYYIIDTLGERLFEGCNQAFILKFDRSSTIFRMPATDSGEQTLAAKLRDSDDIFSHGKESCKEYIKNFLAAIPIRKLQADIKKGLVSSSPVHHRLQIEFHCIQPAAEDGVAVTAMSAPVNEVVTEM